MIQASEIKIPGVREKRLKHRLRLKRLLSTADWQPHGMSPAAVLIVRHLSDPLPGQLTAQPTALRVPRVWETAIKQQMTALYHSAARPYRGQLPLAADAVLFADEAEMLACLALDAARGLSSKRWWWQALRRARPTFTIHKAATLLQTEPRLIPAIFTCLHQWGATAVVTAVLSTDQVIALLTAVTHAFHLPPLPPAQSVRLPTAPDPISVPVLPPWEPFLPSTAVSAPLPAPHACLLGLSLSLVRRPTAVSTSTFQHQLHQWWQAQSQPALEPSPKPAPPTAPAHPLNQSIAAPHSNVAHQERAAAKRPFAPSPSRSKPSTFPSLFLPPAATLGPPSPPSTPPEKPAAGVSETAAAAHAAQPMPPDAPETTTLPAEGFFTRLGGILYLINLMVRLNIPARYEVVSGLASQPGAWGVLELLTRGLLPPIPNHLQDDPIWTALAELDSRIPNGPLLTKSHSWLTLALPDIRAHLLALLHLDDPNRLAETLLLVNGRLHITNTHVNLVMSLADVSLPVRLAGLDINPGWVPALGRVIQFHFQEAL